ncbi:MAG: ribosomal protein S18-alanine N-acetyltransferase [Clostridium sp.]|nr:ribosomal protein S18-alanine N-acetyltransferase [Clostridium sp.]
MLNNLIIRPLEESDIGPLSKIEEASFSMPWSPQDFADLLKRDYCLYLVAEADKKVVGSAGMTDICHEGSIDNVVVAEEYRGQGIAGKLLEALFEIGRERGIKAYTLEVRVSNQAAIHVYEKAGFMSEGIRPRFYEKPTEDALIMWKR